VIASTGDQDRYGLNGGSCLLGPGHNLLLFWTLRDETQWRAAALPAPIRQWLELLRSELGEPAAADLVIAHAGHPLDRQKPSCPATDGLRKLCIGVLRAGRSITAGSRPEGRPAGSGPRLPPAASTRLFSRWPERGHRTALPAAETYRPARLVGGSPGSGSSKASGLPPREWVEDRSRIWRILNCSERSGHFVAAGLLTKPVRAIARPIPPD